MISNSWTVSFRGLSFGQTNGFLQKFEFLVRQSRFFVHLSENEGTDGKTLGERFARDR